MGVTISVPDHGAHVADDQLPTRLGGMSIDDAIYHTVHGYPGGVEALAPRMRVVAGTLTNKANPNNDGHFMRPRELVAMQLMSGDVQVLHAMASALGYTCAKAAPDQAGGNAMEAFMRLQCAESDFTRAVADPLRRMERDASAWVTGAEQRRVEYTAAALHAEVDHMVATSRAHMRPAPKAQG